jgi:hypothetical protein
VYHESFSLDSSSLSRQENVAMKGIATQSSTFGDFYASNAIDGGSVALDQTTADKRSSMTHTDTDSGTDVWWNLELDQDYVISQVIIFNRFDNLEEYAVRIKGFVLQVLDKDDNVVFTHTDPGTYANADTPLSFVIDVDPNTVGKQVRIELRTGEEQKYLSLQEVMVFGVVPPVVVPDVGVGGGTYHAMKKRNCSIAVIYITETKTNSIFLLRRPSH